VILAQPARRRLSGTYRGKQEVGASWAVLATHSFTTDPEHFLADEERGVVLTRTTSDEKSADQVDVLTMRDGKTVKLQSAADTALQEQIFGKK